jgi:DNA-binding GntR family transcriptional regulator
MMRMLPSGAAGRKPGKSSLKGARRKPGKKDDGNIIERKNLDDIIYQRIMQMIINQELLPGQRVYLDHLAEQMGVSRTPVVNALKRLAQERFVDWMNRRGIYIKRLSKGEIAQIYQLREGLESMAARLAATRMDEKEVDRWVAVFKSFKAKEAPAVIRRYLDVDRDFHWRIEELSGNPHLRAAMRIVNMMIAAYWFGLPRTLAEVIPEHMELLDALRRKDPEAAEKAMRVHIRRSVEKLLRDEEAEEAKE